MSEFLRTPDGASPSLHEVSVEIGSRPERKPIVMDSLCGDCNAACCRKHTILELGDDERDFLIGRGANLMVITSILTRREEEIKMTEALEAAGIDPDDVGIILTAPVHRSYAFLEDCPNLVGNVCSVYTNPEKPKICDEFKADTSPCRTMRSHRYLGIGVIGNIVVLFS